MNMQGRHWVGLKVALSAGMIYWILRRADLNAVWQAIAGADRRLLALAFVSYFVGYYLTASRWARLLKVQGVSAPIFGLYKSFMVAMFFNNFLPSTMGGDAVRMFDSWRLGSTKTDAVTVIFVDRFLGLLALLTFAAVGTLLADRVAERVPGLWIWVLGATSGAFGMSLLIFYWPQALIDFLSECRFSLPVKVKGWVDKTISAVSLFRARHDVLAPALILSFILQANVVLHYFLVSTALGLAVPLVSFFAIVPLAIFIMMMPIAINGIGVRESIFTFLLAAYGVSQSQAVAFAWIVYGMILLQGVLGGLVFVCRRSVRQEEANAQ